MPSVTLQCEADAAVTQGGLGAGLGPHLPIGTWSGTRYRAVMRFLAPAGWADWTSITSANLTFWISDHQHVGPANSDIYIRRMATSALWTKSAGTQNCNSGFSGSNATQWDDIIPTSTDQASFASGSVANAKKNPSVTALVRAYQAAGTARIVVVFDQITASDYTELWSREQGSHDPYLTINYEVASVPKAPTPVYPAFESNIWETKPRFTWTHQATEGDPQLDAEVVIGATTLHPAVLTDNFVDMPTDLARAVQHNWKVRTQDVTGWGPYSASIPFAVFALPTVSLGPRSMQWGPAVGAVPAGPRLLVNWSSSGQRKYRVQSGAYDSGWLSDPAMRYHLLPLALSDNVGVPVTVTTDAVDTGTPVLATVSGTIVPRFGLSSHRTNLGANPTAWFSASPVPVSPQPAGTTIHVQYGATSGGAAPATWYDSISDVPLLQFLWYRVYLIPSATEGPALDQIVISSQTSPPSDLDKWSTDPNPTVHTFGPPWVVDESEYVYGSRSCRIDVGASTYVLYGQPVLLKKGRSYVLTGLMKSRLDSGVHFRLEKSPRPDNSDVVVPGQVLRGAVGPLYPDVGDGTAGPMQSPILHVTQTFYGERNDVVRYRTPVYVAPDDIYVRVVLSASAAAAVANTAGYFDAIKLEESSVATPWSPGAVGATIIDAGGVQVDGRRGGIFRYRGSNAPNIRAVVGGGADGLLFAGDTDLSSPATGVLTINGQPIVKAPIVRVNPASPWAKPAGLAYVVVECVGGGGAGGGTLATAAGENASGGGGGAGGYAKRTILAADLPATCAVVVGQGGTGVTGGAGGAGTSSSFTAGAIVVTGSGAGGGNNGSNTSGSTIHPARAGAGASGGDINMTGGPGGAGGVYAAIRVTTGNGGNSVMGGGGAWGSGAVGGAGGNYGGGGGGSSSVASTAARAGGAGGDGVVIVTEYYL